MLETDLRSSGCTTELTMSAVKAVRSGRWAVKMLEIGNLTIFSVPCSLDNTSLGGVDLYQASIDDENGRELSSRDQRAIRGTAIIPPRTVHYLIEQLKSFTVILLHLLGNEALLFRYAKESLAWLDTHRQQLIDLCRSVDPDLPIKIAYYFDLIVNNFLLTAQTQVPTAASLDSTFVRSQILLGTYTIALPRQLADLSSRNKKQNNRRRTNQDPSSISSRPRSPRSTTTSRPRTTNPNSTVTHANQPEQLKVTNETYRLAVGPAIASGSINVPRFHGTDECFRFALRGTCSSNCARASTHITVNSPRREQRLMQARNDIRNHYSQHKRAADPDFR